MKRKLVAAILGIAASVSLVSSAHAQGRVLFNNYGGSGANATFAPVNYGAGTGGTVGAGVNNTFTAGLWYFLGTTTLSAGTGSDTLPAGWELATATQQFNSGATAGAGGDVSLWDRKLRSPTMSVVPSRSRSLRITEQRTLRRQVLALREVTQLVSLSPELQQGCPPPAISVLASRLSTCCLFRSPQSSRSLASVPQLSC